MNISTHEDGSGVGDRARWPSIENSTGVGTTGTDWFLRELFFEVLFDVRAEELEPVRFEDDGPSTFRVFDLVSGPPSTLWSG